MLLREAYVTGRLRFPQRRSEHSLYLCTFLQKDFTTEKQLTEERSNQRFSPHLFGWECCFDGILLQKLSSSFPNLFSKFESFLMSFLQWLLLSSSFAVYLLFGGSMFMLLEQGNEIDKEKDIIVLGRDVQGQSTRNFLASI